MADFQTFADSRSATASAPFAPNPASTSGGSSSPASAAGSLPLSFASGSADDGDRGTNATEQAGDGPAQLMAHWADLGGASPAAPGAASAGAPLSGRLVGELQKLQTELNTTSSAALDSTRSALNNSPTGPEQPANQEGAAEAGMHAVAAHGLTGSAQALPYLEQIQRSFGAGHDVSQIRAVVGGSAKQASERMGASGYASGRSVAFREWPDLALAAHEAAHVIQQRAGVNLEGGVGKQGDEYEQHADAVAERVVAGRSAESLLAPYKDKFQSSHAVQHKKPKDEPSTPLKAFLKQLKENDCKGAAAALDLATTIGQLVYIEEAYKAGYGSVLHKCANIVQSATVRAFIQLYELAHESKNTQADIKRIQEIAQTVQCLPKNHQNALFALIARVRGGTVTTEGLLSLLQANAPAMWTAMGPTTSVLPNPWAPPGRQPIPFYIGNEAHIGIAIQYRIAHAGDTHVYTNSVALKAIVSDAKKLGLAARESPADELNLDEKPDIANLNRMHLYEIKPRGSETLAETTVRRYQRTLMAAGVPMGLGGPAEQGTSGVIPAPGGHYIFQAVLPGVIIYQYRKGAYQPAPVPVTVPSRVPAAQPQEDPSFMKKMEILTGLTGTALVIYIILSEGSRLFPPRNLIPVP